MHSAEFEREAAHELPSLLAELLDIENGELAVRKPRGESKPEPDAVLEVGGWRWIFEIKPSSSPGTVAAAAGQLAELGQRSGPTTIPILLVPHMTPAGARAAADRGLNWLDLSGNAHVRTDFIYIRIEGRPNRFSRRGRPSSPFAPKASRIARVLLLDPSRWWRQKDLAAVTQLDNGYVSRVVGRLTDEDLLDHNNGDVRPRNPELLLDAWADDYKFERHDLVTGHMTGSGVELTAELHQRLAKADIQHSFTGLPAAWALGQHARFRLVTVYVEGDPRYAADAVDLRRGDKGANIQVIGPDDQGVFEGTRDFHGYPCVSAPQIYLDLLHLPERAKEAANQLREDGLLWSTDG